MNLTIRTKLLAGFIIILLLLISATLFVITKFSEANNRIENIVDVSARRIDLSNEILIEMLGAARYEKNIILEREPQKQEDFRLKINKYVAAVNEKIPELYALADDQGKILVNELKNNWKLYLSDLDTIISFATGDRPVDAFELSGSKALKFRDEAIGLMEQLIKQNKQRIADDRAASNQSYTSSLNLIIGLILISLVVAIIISYWIIKSITKRILFIAGEAEKISSREHTYSKFRDDTKDELMPIFNSLIIINESFREVTDNANAVASGNYQLDFVPKSEKDLLGKSLEKMTRSLRETTAENEKHNWLTNGQNHLNESLRGDQVIEELANNTVNFFANYLGSNVGAVYLLDDKKKKLTLAGQYAMASGNGTRKEFSLGEGLVGQAALEQKQIFLSDIQEQHLQITSSVLNTKPSHLLITPFAFENKTLGVIELGKLGSFSNTEKEFINSSMGSIGISINSAIARKKIQELLEETQTQSEELQAQQEELRQINEELEEQTQNLKQQQEELQVTNEELEEQTQALEFKNNDLETARRDIEQKSKQLELSGRYKSEFLANMSHELRTPLNSLLILSKDLADNKIKNLTTEQVESAEIIHKSGHDLLELINEVLDLSKIEAGKTTLLVNRYSLKDFEDTLNRNFRHQADQKGLNFIVHRGDGLPDAIRTDSRRLDQIMRNLLSNAIKFTDKGSVNIDIHRHDEKGIAIRVADTGIGIAEEKQGVIFEAFQQGDGSTSRKYGGTGLGLSISRELCKLLGGEIHLTSKVNKGSTFTLIIPVELNEEDIFSKVSVEKASTRHYTHVFKDNKEFLNYPTIEDDRAIIAENDRIVLIIEDDLQFASILLKQAHEKGFKCLAASTGEDGLLLSEKYKPHAIILDMDLPGINGQKVLAELKMNPTTRHIPVHIMSVSERTMETIKEGALEYLTKPVTKNQLEKAFNRIENFIDRKMKNLLIVEDDDNSRKAIKKIIGNGDVKCFEAGSGEQALAVFKENHIDCIVLDLGLPDISGFALIYELEKSKAGELPPIIIYTGKDLTKAENDELQKYAETIIIKGVKSEERLLDETALFLHRTISDLPEAKQRIIASLYDKEHIFAGKKILVVDDDMRNVFAISKVLKERGMDISKAENGRVALEVLDKRPDIDLVLIDIMMPEMDGYEAMQKIRAQTRFKKLPVIALTAKAMKGDKQKCIDAGANDYIEKPVDLERLLSLMRVWLNK
jgi:signal transduction histidine kinase/CheY-like chemotaxis protein/CHASE3 domain sensor protein